MTGKPQVHGNLNLVEKYYGIPKEKIVSFCENTNPLGLSPLLKKSIIENVDALAKYPDSEYTDLRKSISEYCGVPMEQVIVGGGVTELTSRFVHETGAKKVMLMIPTYFQYAREIKLGGGEVVTYQLPEEDGFEVNLDDFLPMLDESFDLLILCNPNNPTGTVIKRDEMRRIVSRCAELGIYVMVDEVYVDFVDDSIDVTASPLTSEFDNLIVLRGVSKFFDAPGLRVGYAIIGNDEIREHINNTKLPWAINSIVAVSGGAMFKDTEFIQKSLEFCKTERERVYGLLSQEPGLRVFHPTVNLIMLRILKEGVTADMVFEHAIKDGLLIGQPTGFFGLEDTHVCFCLGLPEQNDRLIANIHEALQ